MTAVVEVETGRLEGLSRQAGRTGRLLRSFHAVPYAASPTGDLRFRAPQPAASWAGGRDATRPGAVPMQSFGGAYSNLIPGIEAAAASEDCLTVEIWAPAGATGLPVLVWVPGGAFVTGGAALPTYEGSALAADHDVVVVGVNYRLGAFGFGWPEALGAAPQDSNCGLRDVLAALRWVSRNIEAVGGDPTNVTAFGESAGAGSLLHLLASTAQLPIRRCILQSPGVDHTLRPDQAELVTDTLLRHLAQSQLDGARLRSLPPEAIVEAQEKTVAELMTVVSAMPFHPVVDGDLLLATPSVALAAGAAKDIELLVSWTADEMRLFPNEAADDGGIEVVTDWTRALLARRTGADPDSARAGQLVGFYRDHLAPTGRTRPADVWSAIMTDGVMRLPCRRIADSHAANGGATYVAEFSWHGPVDEGQWDPGAFHAIDLPFTFDTLDGCGWREALHAGPDADQLSQGHTDAWTSFARKGRPESDVLPDWPEYDVEDRPTMILDTPCEVRPDPLAAVDEAWKDLWTAEARAPTL